MFDKFITKDKIIKLTNVNSTNVFAVELLKKKDTFEGTIIWALKQTEGKGQKGNSWESEDGKNLTFTLILHPLSVEPSQQFMINKAVSLGIIDFLKTKIEESQIKIKWPNDIYVNKSKIAGILIENEILGAYLQSTIVGIGLNVNQISFSEKILNPVSLQLITGKEMDIEIILTELLNKIESRILDLYNNEIELINYDYLNSLLYYNVYKNYLIKNIQIQAMIIGLSEFGQLILKTKEEKLIKCDFKEIVFQHD
ncbi:MAG: biotin--[acetyl-CoA-carboxylase] ligase [Bacteroidales bacterium]